VGEGKRRLASSTGVPRVQEHEPTPSPAGKWRAAITLDQLKRGIAAIDAHTELLATVGRAFAAAGQQRIDSLGGEGLVHELLSQLEERCNDPPGRYDGSMIDYMMYEGRGNGGRCVSSDGHEVSVNSPENLWRWWRITETGPFTLPTSSEPADAREHSSHPLSATEAP
jgi:hypothetical protein